MEQTQIRTTARRRHLEVMAVASFVAVGLAACGTSAMTASSSTTTGASATAPVVSASDNLLVSNGKTLYTLVPDSTPCDASCTKIWPELVLPKGVTMATAGSGVSASALGTKDLGGGVLQVTYGGKPLYFFAEDGPGQVTGNITDTWGKWSDVTVTAAPAAATTTSSTPAGAGTKSVATTQPAVPRTTQATNPPTTQATTQVTNPPTTQATSPPTTQGGGGGGGGGGVGF